jgi:hypothetical protein
MTITKQLAKALQEIVDRIDEELSSWTYDMEKVFQQAQTALAAYEASKATPAQDQDIERLTRIACETYEKSNPAHEIASWKGMRAAILAVQQKLRERE